jgi:hypothetical protein
LIDGALPFVGMAMPAPLKVLWTIWLVAVSVNVVVWVLVVGSSGHFVYPWPVWVGSQRNPAAT